MKSVLSKSLLIVFLLTTVSSLYGQKDSNANVKSLMSTYYNENFSPFQKGNWFVAFSMSLNNEEFENSEYRFEKIIEGNKENFELDLRTGYYFNDYFSGSLGLIIAGDSFDRKVPKLLGFIDRSSTTKTYGVSPALRSSIPVVPNHRLNLYIDLGFNFNWGKTTVDDIENEALILSNVSNNFDFGVGIKPGITFFVMENFALEIGLEILGYNYSSTKTNFVDESPEEKYSAHSIDFDLSLSTLQLSLSYYIGSKKQK